MERISTSERVPERDSLLLTGSYLEKLVIWRQGWPCDTGTRDPRRREPRPQIESSQKGRPGLRTTDSPAPAHFFTKL